MPRLMTCPSCHSHVLVGDRQCPHCGVALRTTAAPRVTTMLLGLTLAGCPGDDTGEDTVGGSSTATTADSATSTTTATGTDTATGTATGTTAISSSGPGDEAAYGVPDSGIDESTATDTGTSGSGSGTDSGSTGTSGTDTGSSTDSGTTGSDSVGEPEYGVPETKN